MRWVRMLLVVLVLVAACGGGGDKESATTSTTKVAGSKSTTSTTAKKSGAKAGSGTTTTTEAKASGAGNTATTIATESSSGDKADDPRPRAGTATYHTTGTTKYGATNRKVDADTDTIIQRLSGNRLRTVNDGQKTVLHYTDTRVELLTLDTSIPTFERHFEADPPVEYGPRPLRVGDSWEWQLQATGKPTTIKQSSKVDRTENLTVNGKTVKTTVVITKIIVSGDVKLTINLEQWIAADQTSQKIHSVTTGTYNNVPFSSDTTSVFVKFVAD